MEEPLKVLVKDTNDAVKEPIKARSAEPLRFSRLHIAQTSTPSFRIHSENRKAALMSASAIVATISSHNRFPFVVDGQEKKSAWAARRSCEKEHGWLIGWPPRLVRRAVRMDAGIPAFRFSQWIRKEGVDVRGH